ncbi:MAG: Ig-like domain-containing protein, partial [Bacteroidota bacterium]
IQLIGCANMVAPTGGPRDSVPPQMIRAHPAMRSTGINIEKVTLAFDEFVRIQNRSAIRLLPETNKQPIIKEALNRIELDFSQVALDPTTTYVLYMNDAIADFTEGNKLKDFTYIFSTGSSIDTGWISGRVIDAHSSKPKAQVRVGLYDWGPAGDSVVYRQKARYSTMTNDSGIFYLGYLPDRDFRLFVWVDDNKDGLYKAGEAFDFLDAPSSAVNGVYDSSQRYSLRITVDRDEQARIIEYSEKWPGWLGITFSSRPSVLNWVVDGRALSDSMAQLHYWKGDTAMAYVGDAYTKAEAGAVVGLCRMIHRTDTIFRKIKPAVESRKTQDTSTAQSCPQLSSLWVGTPVLCAGKGALRFSSDWPLNRVDSARFMWVDTLSRQIVHTGAVTRYAGGCLFVQVPKVLAAGRVYKLFMPKGSIIGAGEQALDSMVQVFKVEPDTAERQISVILSNKESRCLDWPDSIRLGRYVEIFDESGYQCGVFRFTDIDRGQWDHGSPKLGLMPGAYTIKIYFDENNNKQLDSASWRLGRRAEYNRTATWILSTSDAREYPLDLCTLIWK